MTRDYLITMKVSEKDGYFGAQARLYDRHEFMHGSESAPEPLMRSEVCSSRDEKRAASYALADLAAKISGGR